MEVKFRSSELRVHTATAQKCLIISNVRSMFGRHSGNRTVPTLGLHLEIDRTLLAKMSQRDQFQLDVIFK